MSVRFIAHSLSCRSSFEINTWSLKASGSKWREIGAGFLHKDGNGFDVVFHFTPDVQAKLDQMARDAGCQPAEVIEDAVIGLYDELAYTREMLDRRYDEMESGKLQGIDGEEAYRRLMEKTQALRSRRPT
jgi:hypothetical protein